MLHDFLSDLANGLAIIMIVVTAARSAGKVFLGRLKTTWSRKRPTDSTIPTTETTETTTSQASQERWDWVLLGFRLSVMVFSVVFLIYLTTGRIGREPALVHHVALVGMLLYNVLTATTGFRVER